MRGIYPSGWASFISNYTSGTYTTQARNKRGNRKCEHLLHDAEFFSVLVPGAAVTEANAARAVYDVAPRGEPSVESYLDRAWKLLLLNQFHDIIPGSSISWVYEDSGRDYETISRLCEAIIFPARGQLAAEIDTSAAERPAIVFNTTGFPRAEVVSLRDGTPVWVQVGAVRLPPSTIWRHRTVPNPSRY